MKNNLFYFIRHYRTSKLAHLSVSLLLHQILIGVMMGDLHVEKPSSKHNARLQFKQSTVNSEYIVYMYELLKVYCGTPPIWLSYFDKRNNRNKTYTSLKLQTLSLPCFNVYRELFYDASGTKYLPSNLSDHFTNISLAH